MTAWPRSTRMPASAQASPTTSSKKYASASTGSPSVIGSTKSPRTRRSQGIVIGRRLSGQPADLVEDEQDLRGPVVVRAPLRLRPPHDASAVEEEGAAPADEHVVGKAP